MLRQVSSRSALRARPGTPALLVAAEALRTPPERVFAGTAGSWGREGESQASSLRFAARATARASRRDAGSRPAARRSPTQRTAVSRKAVGGRRAQRLCGDEKRRAGVGARSALRGLTCRSLFERSERSERSEFCGATPARASQCSRRAAPTAAAKRSTPPAHGFARAELARTEVTGCLMAVRRPLVSSIARSCAAGRSPSRRARSTPPGCRARPTARCRGPCRRARSASTRRRA